MIDGNAAECVVTYQAPEAEMEVIESNPVLRMRSIPWTTVILDALLAAGLLLASSSLLTLR
jgi:hypothetical protein